MKRHLITLTFTLLAIISALGRAEELESRPLQAFKGRPAATLAIADVNGKAIALADFKGKVVVLNLWATWCPPCVRELPSLEQLQRELGKDGLEVLAVSADIEGVKKVAPFYQEMRINLPIYVDEGGALYRALDIRGLPTTFILNRQGEFVAKIEGDTNWVGNDMLTYLKALLSGN